MNNKDITLKNVQRTVDQWVKEYGVRYFSELTNLACLTEEVGELARIMARKYGDQSFKIASMPSKPNRRGPHGRIPQNHREKNKQRQSQTYC